MMHKPRDRRKSVLIIGEIPLLMESLSNLWPDSDVYCAATVEDWLRNGPNVIPDVVVSGIRIDSEGTVRRPLEPAK